MPMNLGPSLNVGALLIWKKTFGKYRLGRIVVEVVVGMTRRRMLAVV